MSYGYSNNCTKCNKPMKVDPTRVLTSMPPQPCYYCPSCDGERFINKFYDALHEFDQEPKWVNDSEARSAALKASLPVGGWLAMFDSVATGSDLLLSISDSTRFVLIAGCDISGNRKIVKSKKLCLVLFVNNKSEVWWRRFGFCVGGLFSSKLK
jgi:hypothetical protein